MLGRVRCIIYSTNMICLRDVTWRGVLHYDRKFQIFIFLIGYINKCDFCLIISYLRIKSYNVLNYNNCSTDCSFPLRGEWVFILFFWQGIARTQSPTLKNCVPELLTFGAIAGFSQTGVQWKGLDLGRPPFWSRCSLYQVSMLKFNFSKNLYKIHLVVPKGKWPYFNQQPKLECIRLTIN